MNPNIKCTCPFGNPKIGVDNDCPIHGVGEYTSITTDGALEGEALPEGVSVEGMKRPGVKDFFTDMANAHEEYIQSPGMFNYIQSLDNYIDELESLLKEKEDEITQLKSALSKAQSKITELLIERDERK